MRRALALTFLLAAMPCCLGTTGNQIVEFYAAAAGPSDASAGGTMEFTSGRGSDFHVVLTRATLHIGALYLNQSLPVSGAQETSCVLPGTYVAEMTTGLDVDLLSPTAQLFPAVGTGTDLHGRAGEVWLSGPDINRTADPTPILILEGSADRGGQAFPFKARLTIGQNRATPSSDPAQPGANPICKERIVTPIPTDIVPRQGGTLLLRIDPRLLFVNVDFSLLKQFSVDPPVYGFEDTDADQPSINLYQALRSAGALYRFEWSDAGR